MYLHLSVPAVRISGSPWSNGIHRLPRASRREGIVLIHRTTMFNVTIVLTDPGVLFVDRGCPLLLSRVPRASEVSKVARERRYGTRRPPAHFPPCWPQAARPKFLKRLSHCPNSFLSVGQAGGKAICKQIKSSVKASSHLAVMECSSIRLE